jgi:hypothetical protein
VADELSSVRVSDREREDAVSRLRSAAGEGRLTFEELAERTELAYAARTDAELARIAEDLPATAAPSRRVESAAAGDERTDWVLAVMGGAERKGRWRVRNRTQAVALMGGVELDLRQAELPVGDVEITAWAIMGGVDVRVPDGVRVEMGGFALMGGNTSRGPADAPPPGAPTVRVRAYSIMGGVNVRRKRLDKGASGGRHLLIEGGRVRSRASFVLTGVQSRAAWADPE